MKYIKQSVNYIHDCLKNYLRSKQILLPRPFYFLNIGSKELFSISFSLLRGLYFMGRKKEVIYRGNALVGKYLSDSDCNRLDKIIDLSQKNGCVSDLKNIIYCLEDYDVIQAKEMGQIPLLIAKPEGELTDTETVGVAYMYWVKRCILGDSVGLGKTVQVCGLFNLLEREAENQGRDFKFLYLTEKTLVEDVHSSIIKFTGNYADKLFGDKNSVSRYLKNNSHIPNSIVGAHSLINQALFQEFLLSYLEKYGRSPFDILVIDESSILGSSKTKTYKNAQLFKQGLDRVILLNATPFELNLEVFYNQLAYVDETFLPTKTQFNQEFVVMDWSRGIPVPSGKYKNAEQFRQQVRYRYFARTRLGIGADVGRDCTAKIVLSPLDAQQKKLLSRTSMPYMVYDCPSYFNNFAGSDIVYSGVPPKVHSLVDLLRGELADVGSVLIYCRYKEAQHMIKGTLEMLGYQVGVMNGDSDIDEKNFIIDSFKNGSLDILITNVQKGLNFGNCNYCIFYSFDPNPNRMVQFEGRMTRGTSIVNKHSYVLCSEGKEYKRLNEVIADRANASKNFAGSDFSCILGLLVKDKLSAES